jgi:hypothetical protein
MQVEQIVHHDGQTRVSSLKWQFPGLTSKGTAEFGATIPHLGYLRRAYFQIGFAELSVSLLSSFSRVVDRPNEDFGDVLVRVDVKDVRAPREQVGRASGAPLPPTDPAAGPENVDYENPAQVVAPAPWIERCIPPALGEPPYDQAWPPRRGRVSHQGPIHLHFCITCGAWGTFGYGLIGDHPGRWYCRAHRATSGKVP